MTTTAADLLQAIDTAYNDAEIQAEPELKERLMTAAKQLGDKKDYHKVAAELSQALKYWGMAHLHGPKALDAVYEATIEASRGLAYQKPYSTPKKA
ncbi:bacteriocin immunity protein [Lactiplantibacillus mudanjiangensis]|uniref:Bacteriocin immunity protein n=1 Tax=Lactiplantibacillus mudanjiangensis TaxID=1296538 RepID=A0A660DZ86_9LACO|nr:bacteriocin immunity protein [Lactiplantibacillus mudanjiangensis]VDG18953.1 hypothetical protein [Lactobacillus farciminis KCTC 3681 = DSM 20184] [Lactiplantibacillus mudanjiangensis]VDG25270.1 hypothetical protein [Lactobacillus farciminis KCTC 3681 = DSM 20184] [Lactiplantibacillus mudanjiangensis]VDG27477.1 hypothetical protein [Lactobacillus farciminis KCTC 3681 = DSM 20184] [Lactiplantibacillus mudanjiangensis]VDG33054.1 hypothetical protein [Lactobacillus farciminis KCTC 3681 = DSM 20